MKKKIFILIFAIFGVLTMNSAKAQTWPPDGMQGDGTENSPWQITTPADLEALALYVNAGNGELTSDVYYKLMKNIDLSGYDNWIPIGKYDSESYTSFFRGNVDGNGKKIENLTIYYESYSGLFGATINAQIKNLGIENYDIKGANNIGGLVGWSDNSIITNSYAIGRVSGLNGPLGGLIGNSLNNSNISNCYTKGSVISGSGAGGYSHAGGLVGISWNSTISNCYSTDSISGTGGIGGLVGTNDNSTISACYATGNVDSWEDWTGVNYSVGGLVGITRNSSKISNSYAIGNVNGNNMVGGLAGISISSTISNSYATGNVSGSDNVGGVLGYNRSSSVHNCLAANDSLSSGLDINRIAGWNEYDYGFFYYNYAINTMIVESNGVHVNITDDLNGLSGMSKEITTLQSRSFYATVENWQGGLYEWDIVSPTSTWDIRDGESLPFLRWQGAPVSILENTITSVLTIYPNPTSEKFIFDFDRVATIKLYDMLGREALTQNILGKTEINISHLPKGIYCIRVISEGKVIGNSKIIKQ